MGTLIAFAVAGGILVSVVYEGFFKKTRTH